MLFAGSDHFVFFFCQIVNKVEIEVEVDLLSTLFSVYKNVVFPAEAEYSYFSANFRPKIFLYYS